MAKFEDKLTPQSLGHPENEIYREAVKRAHQYSVGSDSFHLSEPEDRFAAIINTQQSQRGTSGKGNCSAVAITHAAIAAGPEAMKHILTDLQETAAATEEFMVERRGYSRGGLQVRQFIIQDMINSLDEGWLTTEQLENVQTLLHERLMASASNTFETFRATLGAIDRDALDMIPPGGMREYLNQENKELGQILADTGQQIILGELAGVGIPNHYIAKVSFGGHQFIAGLEPLVYETMDNSRWSDTNSDWQTASNNIFTPASLVTR